MGFLQQNRTVLASLLVLAAALAWVVGAHRQAQAPQAALSAECRTPRLEQEQRLSSSTEDLVVLYQERIKRCQADQLAYSRLGAAYLQRARETGDPSYYAKAEEVLASATQQAPDDLLVLELQAMLALSRHQFSLALDLAQRAQALNPNRAEVYGLLSDAQVELGLYTQAISSVQRMVDLRPNLNSYARVSHLRELHGDIPGALEAMQQAVEAGGAAAEPSAWTIVQLGNLHFKAGALAAAEREYRRALTFVPDYIHAQAGLARIEVARKHYDEARALYQTVTERVPLPEYVIALGELEIAAGNPDQAERQFGLVDAIDSLQQANGMATDLEMALFLADHGSAQAAVKRAQAAYRDRPGIYGADVLAWALSQAGNQPEAQHFIDEALRLGTRDSLLFYHAGMIAYRRGDLAGARSWLQEALALNPFFSPIYADHARDVLAQLQKQ